MAHNELTTVIGQVPTPTSAEHTGERMDAVRMLYNSTNADIEAAPEWTVSPQFRTRWRNQHAVYLDWYRQHRMSQHARRDPAIARMAETFLRELLMWRRQARDERVELSEADPSEERPRPRQARRSVDDDAMWGVGRVRPSTSFYGERWDQQGRQLSGRPLQPGVTILHPWARYESIPWTPGQTRTRLPADGLAWNPGQLPRDAERRIIVGQARLHDPIAWSPAETAERMDLVHSEYANFSRDVRAMPEDWRAANQRWKAAWSRQFEAWNEWYAENRRTIWSPISGLLGGGEDPAVMTPATANRYLEQLVGYRAAFRERGGQLTTPDPPRPPVERRPGDWLGDIGEAAKAIGLLLVIGLIAMAVLK